MRKAALTELPIIPPMVLKLSKRLDTAAAVAATTMEVMMTMLRSAVSRGFRREDWIQLTSNVLGRNMFPP